MWMTTFRSSRCALAALAAGLALSPAGATAGEADVLEAVATETGEGIFRFDVTVAHADAGWDHYADRFEIVGPDGAIIATRVLLHPHDHEQPFTRSLTGVEIPPGIAAVTVRAHDSVHEYGGAEISLTIR